MKALPEPEGDLRERPARGGEAVFSPDAPVLRVRGLVKHFRRRGSWFGPRPAPLAAVDGVDLEIAAGETLGLVGESGCGKSTLARCILHLVPPTAGVVEVGGVDLGTLRQRELRRFRRHMQIVFQDPYGSLNPRLTVGQALEEPLAVHGVGDGRERRRRVEAMLQRVGLRRDQARRYPHEFSGGQRQRIVIARALILRPRLVIADEPVSALDTSVAAQILNLLQDLQEEMGLAYLLIAHDLAVVRHLSHRIAVMYAGRVVEEAPAEELMDHPLHPYTQALLAAAPRLGTSPAGAVPAGDVLSSSRKGLPSPEDLPSPESLEGACPFHPRCPLAMDRCLTEEPHLRPSVGGHRVACWAVEETDPPVPPQ